MQPLVSVIIPCAPYHRALLGRALQSVAAQGVPCESLVIVDHDRNGAGWARNQGLAQATAPFVLFLDADDWLEAHALTTMLTHWIPGKYVYCDWYQDDEIKRAPEHPWCAGTWHTVTSLVPTAAAHAVGGFDEYLPAAEDTDFFLKLTTRGTCGVHAPAALMHYSKDGQRARAFHDNRTQYSATMNELTRRYGGHMGCCGQANPVVGPPAGERAEGDVLAMALWGGNRETVGRVTGRHYPRISSPKTAWVDPRDVAAMPSMWREIVEAVPVIEPADLLGEDGFAALMAQIKDHRGYSDPVPVVEVNPNVRRVVTLGRAALTLNKAPLFVFPAKAYPSYADFRALVRLAGFESITIDQANLRDQDATFIVTGPDVPDAMPDAQARMIWWDMEWTYAHQPRPAVAGIREVWASDRWYAQASGARYVMLGSDPRLNLHPEQNSNALFDVTMLGYMVARRQQMKHTLADLRWPEDYPGHEGEDRHRVLRDTRLMLHVHQHEDVPAVAPLRLAVAAAYRMPVISERVNEGGDYAGMVHFMPYGDLATATRALLANDLMRDQFSMNLHTALCYDMPFAKMVREALR